MKLKYAAIATVAAMAVAAFAYAQPPGRGFRGAATTTGTTRVGPDAAVKTYLTLTDSQLTGFDAIRTTARTASEPIRTQLRTKMDALRAAMNATPVVAATITSLQADIAALQAQLDKIQADARAQMIATLGADQKTKLAVLTAAAALRGEVQGASMLGLVAGGPGGGPGGGFGKGKGKGGGRGF
ncbi:MAG: periplasmic heavy metal sensor [Bryobacteraceae bacterium]